MTAIIEHPALLSALTRVRGAVERRATIPILGHALIEAEGAAIQITATDLDIEVTARAEARVSAPFCLTVPSDLLADLVKAAPRGCEIEMTPTDTGLRLRWGRATATLRTLPADDFPRFVVRDEPQMAPVTLDALAGAFAFCAPSISTEETQYHLNGVYAHPRPDGDGALRCVATDGHKLGQADTEISWHEAWPEGGVILPRKTVRMLLDAAGPAEIGVTETLFCVAAEGWTVRSKVIDGKFPEYSRVVPERNASDRRITLDRAALAAAVQVALVAGRGDTKSPAVKIAPDPSGAAVTLSAASADFGSAEIAVDARLDNPGAATGFNARYLVDFLAIMNAGDLTIHQSGDASSPALISQPDTPRVLVLMPMRVA